MPVMGGGVGWLKPRSDRTSPIDGEVNPAFHTAR